MPKTSLPVIEAPRQYSIIRPNPEKRPHLIASRGRLLKPRIPTPENPLIISASELRDFLRCRVKWHWRYQARIEPKTKSSNLKIGTLTHHILDKWYQRSNRTVKAMRKIANSELLLIPAEYLPIKDVELIREMCIGYAFWAKQEDKDLVPNNIRTELKFDLPLDEKGRIRVHGYIDVDFDHGRLRRTAGMMEHKTAGQFRSSMLELNLQLSVYLWALRMIKPKARRYIAYRNTLRKQMPGPRVRAALFQREEVERMDDEIDQWRQDTARAAMDMVDAAIYPTPADDCAYLCDFQTPCMMRGRREDLEFVLTHDYASRDNRT